MAATTSAFTTLTGTPTSNSTFSSASTVAPTTSSGSSSDGTLDAMTFTGVPLRTVFYFIAFMALIMAIFYAFFIARRDRRRRQRNRADTEAGRHTSTYRPDTDEESPPGYRSYMLDQPYVDAEMVAILPPQDAHFDQHLNALEQQLNMEQALNSRSLISSYTTTTTTTLSTFMPGASSSGVSSVEGSETVSTEPTFIARPEGLVATASLRGSTSETSSTVNGGNENNDNVPVIAEPVPAASFLSGRHLSILRFGLRGSNNIHSGSSSHRNSRHSETSSVSGSRPPSPTLSSPRSSTALLTVPEISTGETQPQMTEVTSSSSLSHPLLHRLRSQGPPPYVPSTEEAPPLPPSYNHAVEIPQ
ncbi:hypothetical protein CPB97_003562 [Podila verticillata]|nr:hypothetical protein CPB97_003562 [Podila verticillata]